MLRLTPGHNICHVADPDEVGWPDSIGDVQMTSEGLLPARTVTFLVADDSIEVLPTAGRQPAWL
jgi:hypothetical protein